MLPLKDMVQGGVVVVGVAGEVVEDARARVCVFVRCLGRAPPSAELAAESGGCRPARGTLQVQSCPRNAPSVFENPAFSHPLLRQEVHWLTQNSNPGSHSLCPRQALLPSAAAASSGLFAVWRSLAGSFCIRTRCAAPSSPPSWASPSATVSTNGASRRSSSCSAVLFHRSRPDGETVSPSESEPSSRCSVSGRCALHPRPAQQPGQPAARVQGRALPRHPVHLRQRQRERQERLRPGQPRRRRRPGLPVVVPGLLDRLRKMRHELRGPALPRPVPRHRPAVRQDRLPHALLQRHAQLRQIRDEPDAAHQLDAAARGLDAQHRRGGGQRGGLIPLQPVAVRAPPLSQRAL